MDHDLGCIAVVVVGVAVWFFTSMVCGSIEELSNIKVSSSDRYELKQIGSMVRNQYLTDKETGRVWQLVEDPKTHKNWLMELYIENLHNPNEKDSEE